MHARIAASEFACLLNPTIDTRLAQHCCELLRLIVGLAITKRCLPRVFVRAIVFVVGIRSIGNKLWRSRAKAE